MNWRLKARIQNAVALLPPSVSNAAYFQLQRHFGGMRRVSPVDRMTGAMELCERLERTGATAAGARFLEVGTGWRINLPLALWLSGAASVTTVDLNRYIREGVIRLDLRFIREQQPVIVELLGARLDRDRLASLIEFSQRPWKLPDLLRFCSITYIAPGDATCLPLDAGSIDHQMSYAVLEHIPRPVLQAMATEAHRILTPGGTSAHRIDLSDHFRKFDSSISPLNFLRFNEREWNAVSGNRFMFTNRLRVDDYVGLFEEAGFDVPVCDRYENPNGLAALRDPSFRLDESFRGKSESDLATTSVWMVARKRAA